MKLGIFHFELLYNVLLDMHFTYDEEEMADMVLSRISQALDAEAGTLFRINEDGSLFPLASHGMPRDELRKHSFKTGVGVVGWVAQYLQPVKVDKPEADPRFFGRVDTVSGFKTRNIVAAPVIVRDQAIGVIEFINRRNGPFVIQDLELISMIGRQIAIALLNARVIREKSHLAAFQHAVFGSLSAGLLVVDADGRIRELNARCADILKRPAAELEKRPLREAVQGSDVLASALEEALSSGQRVPRGETILKRPDGDRRIGFSTVPVLDGSARIGAALLFQDLSEVRS